jgi:hypothetical protein
MQLLQAHYTKRNTPNVPHLSSSASPPELCLPACCKMRTAHIKCPKQRIGYSNIPNRCNCLVPILTFEMANGLCVTRRLKHAPPVVLSQPLQCCACQHVQLPLPPKHGQVLTRWQRSKVASPAPQGKAHRTSKQQQQQQQQQAAGDRGKGVHTPQLWPTTGKPRMLLCINVHALRLLALE